MGGDHDSECARRQPARGLSILGKSFRERYTPPSALPAAPSGLFAGKAPTRSDTRTRAVRVPEAAPHPGAASAVALASKLKAKYNVTFKVRAESGTSAAPRITAQAHADTSCAPNRRPIGKGVSFAPADTHAPPQPTAQALAEVLPQHSYDRAGKRRVGGASNRRGATHGSAGGPPLLERLRTHMRIAAQAAAEAWEAGCALHAFNTMHNSALYTRSYGQPHCQSGAVRALASRPSFEPLMRHYLSGKHHAQWDVQTT